MQLNSKQHQEFARDGLLILGQILHHDEVALLRTSFRRLFNGEFETGILPDEVNWQEGKSDPTLSRQICNGWRADRNVARTIFREDLGKCVAELMDWPGARVMQDNVIWKPIGAKSLGFHQDNAYLQWLDPGEICSVWMALDDVKADSGTMELVRGSHRWPLTQLEGEFHGPPDYLAPMRKRAAEIHIEPDVVPVVVPSGGGSIHHGVIWHGSGPNTGSTPRRSLVLHAMSSESVFRRENFNQGIGPIYARYSRLDSNQLDENYFPITWRKDGYRTPGLSQFVKS